MGTLEVKKATEIGGHGSSTLGAVRMLPSKIKDPCVRISWSRNKLDGQWVTRQPLQNVHATGYTVKHNTKFPTQQHVCF